MFRSYPIYNIINSCSYKQSNKSYGVNEHSSILMKVGSSKINSHLMCEIKQTRKRFEDWDVFRLRINDKIVCQTYFNHVTKEFRKNKPKELKELI